jgi:hypothetical protein
VQRHESVPPTDGILLERRKRLREDVARQRGEAITLVQK